jgi:uncharacterized iron-regulated membrane protein
MAMNLRQLWLRTHRWLGLSVGWILALVALMGATLVVLGPLDRALHPELFKPRSGPHAMVALEPLRAKLIGEFGKDATLTFRPPREAQDSLWVLVRAKWSGTVYIDPATGLEQGRRGESEGFRNTLFKLHSALGLQDTGKAMLAWIALGYLFFLISGLILWWPRRWPPSLRIELRKGLLRGLFDLHRTGGAVLGLLIAMSVATGAYMAWRPLGEVVTSLAGGKPVKPPKVPKASAQLEPVALDALVATARAQFPNGAVGYVQVSGQDSRPVRVRLILPDDPHPNGLTSVWLNQRGGAVLGANRWNELDPGARAVAVVYPLHTGELGGAWLEALVMVNGLVLGTLGISGIWLWWKRRRTK